MKTLTQDQVNKACRSRSLKEIDDVLMKIKLELMANEEYFNELSLEHKKPSMSERYEMNVLKLNKDRLEDRVVVLGKRMAVAQKKKDEEQARLQMYIDLAKTRMPIQQAVTTINKSSMLTGDKIADAAVLNVQARAKELIAEGNEVSPELFHQIANEFKIADGSKFKVTDLAVRDDGQNINATLEMKGEEL